MLRHLHILATIILILVVSRGLRFSRFLARISIFENSRSGRLNQHDSSDPQFSSFSLFFQGIGNSASFRRVPGTFGSSRPSPISLNGLRKCVLKIGRRFLRPGTIPYCFSPYEPQCRRHLHIFAIILLIIVVSRGLRCSHARRRSHFFFALFQPTPRYLDEEPLVFAPAGLSSSTREPSIFREI